MSELIKTKMGNTFQILKTESFTDFATIAPKFGQGCNYETGKCVEGFQVDFSIEVEKTNGEKERFHIAFQSLERSDNMSAYSSSEMSPAVKYGCDSDEVALGEFSDYDEEILHVLQEKAEKECKEWFKNN